MLISGPARLQGAPPGRKANAIEVPVLSYENQQLTLLPMIAMSYGCLFNHRRLRAIYDSMLTQLDGSINAHQLDMLNQLHATSSGLKAFVTTEASNGMERMRRACGGHGFSASSNIPHLMQEFVGACTFEGTFDVLIQQHAASLFKRLHKPVNVRAAPRRL
ncbi:hypothetical protein SDRG_05849 [Saprolegnia diclina VS20]|uniref:Acyl-CoA oxidase C-alpha1 domain-containing protein n=1 Tax=Saprolegnia diclina (strain VS20) TaxID=1156394 RepID=T0QSR0_SAPDV|nr:hypothetical protein SDRG_05849 [Saprolegnia diclina VS20]EQC37030.1 hypothetical protein SDRG_05849 [Saprolegnia diclina VS20]|eukprot:XP_008609811.1 hypothetical protein SDRG_05849 [Saprolegnia diclina VS20]